MDTIMRILHALWPFVTRSRFKGVVAWRDMLQKRAEDCMKENTALTIENAELKTRCEHVIRDNVAAAKIIGVICRRQIVRVAVDDLRGKLPKITVGADDRSDARKPTLRVNAIYDDKPIPDNEEVVVGRDDDK